MLDLRILSTLSINSLVKTRGLGLVIGKSKRKQSRTQSLDLTSKESENSLGSKCRLERFGAINLDLTKIKLLLAELGKNIQV